MWSEDGELPPVKDDGQPDVSFSGACDEESLTIGLKAARLQSDGVSQSGCLARALLRPQCVLSPGVPRWPGGGRLCEEAQVAASPRHETVHADVCLVALGPCHVGALVMVVHADAGSVLPLCLGRHPVQRPLPQGQDTVRDHSIFPDALGVLPRASVGLCGWGLEKQIACGEGVRSD